MILVRVLVRVATVDIRQHHFRALPGEENRGRAAGSVKIAILNLACARSSDNSDFVLQAFHWVFTCYFLPVTERRAAVSL